MAAIPGPGWPTRSNPGPVWLFGLGHAHSPPAGFQGSLTTGQPALSRHPLVRSHSGQFAHAKPAKCMSHFFCVLSLKSVSVDIVGGQTSDIALSPAFGFVKQFRDFEIDRARKGPESPPRWPMIFRVAPPRRNTCLVCLGRHGDRADWARARSKCAARRRGSGAAAWNHSMLRTACRAALCSNSSLFAAARPH